MGDGMSDASSYCETRGCGNVVRGHHAFCWSCREQIRAANGDTNKMKSQASVMLVFPGPDKRRYRIVSFSGEKPGSVAKYVLDEEREDTVGDKFWHPTHNWSPTNDVKIVDVLMSAIQYLMNPNAMIANDAELEGRPADAKAIMQQTKLQATCRRCGFQFTHEGTLTDMTTDCPECKHGQVPNFTANSPQCKYPGCRRQLGHEFFHIDQGGESIMCSRGCGQVAEHGGKCFEAHP